MIVTIGEILVEIMATRPGHGFREPLPLIGPYPSGAPAIFIDQVGRLGEACGIVSAVGDDDFGHLNLDRLRRDGVDVSAVAVLDDAVTGSAFVRYRPDGGRDFVFNLRDSACGRVAPTPAGRALLARATHLHVMGSALSIPGVLGWISGAMDEVRGRGGTVSFDPNVRKEVARDPAAGAALRAVLARTDLFLPSGEELLLLTDAADEADAIAGLLAAGVSEVVLKRGAAGSTHFDRAGRTDAPGFPVTEVDPTGAGDCFGAVYVVCRRRGMGVAEALRLANAAGARTVTVRGPMEGAASLAELHMFLAGFAT
jgi:sugar/nucleoside kinase (ribokinase family)